MSDPMHPSEPIPPAGVRAQSTTVMDPVDPLIPAAPPRHDADDKRPRNPLDDITPERPKSHPVAYAALALATLALLLSLLGMRGDDNGGFRQVRIGNNDCVIGQQGDTDVLYCRTPAVPAP